jgi:hypothetical protein
MTPDLWRPFCSLCDQVSIVRALEAHGIEHYCSRCALGRAREVAEQRQTQGRRAGSTRPLRTDMDWLGLLGELAFARRYDLPVRFKDVPEGDRGVDFETPLGWVDVKATPECYDNLLVPADADLRADLYVVARVGRAVCLSGWCLRAAVERAPVRTLKIPTRVIAAQNLHPIDEFDVLHTNATVYAATGTTR